MKSDNLREISPDKLQNWKPLGEVAFELAAKAALKQAQKAEVPE